MELMKVMKPISLYRSYIKPLYDFLIALVALVLLLPICLFVMLWLAFANKGNPFFIQPRPGKNGKVFKLLKFKTMNDRRDAHGKLLPDC